MITLRHVKQIDIYCHMQLCGFRAFLHLLQTIIGKPCKNMRNVVYENRTPLPQPERILIENLTPELP